MRYLDDVHPQSRVSTGQSHDTSGALLSVLGSLHIAVEHHLEHLSGLDQWIEQVRSVDEIQQNERISEHLVLRYELDIFLELIGSVSTRCFRHEHDQLHGLQRAVY